MRSDNFAFVRAKTLSPTTVMEPTLDQSVRETNMTSDRLKAKRKHEQRRRYLAYHEAGHAVMAGLVGYQDVFIEHCGGIMEDGTKYEARCCYTSYNSEETQQGRINHIYVILAGIAATIIKYRESAIYAFLSGGERDWNRALAKLPESLAIAKERELRGYLRDVKKILRANWSEVERLSDCTNHQETTLPGIKQENGYYFVADGDGTFISYNDIGVGGKYEICALRTDEAKVRQLLQQYSGVGGIDFITDPAEFRMVHDCRVARTCKLDRSPTQGQTVIK